MKNYSTLLILMTSVLLILSVTSKELLIDMRDMYDYPNTQIFQCKMGDNVRILFTERPTNGYHWLYVFSLQDTASAINKKV